MSERGNEHTELDATVISRIAGALSRHQSEVGPMEIAADEATRTGNRVYVPVRALSRPPSMFPFMYALAGAEVDLRDQGLDVILVPEYRQSYVVVARVPDEEAPLIFDSEEGSEMKDLLRLLGKVSWPAGEPVSTEGYAYDGPADRDKALAAALEEYPHAKVLA